MHRKKRIFLALFLLCTLFSGCKKTPSQSTLDIATAITVQCNYQQTPFQRNYTNADKIDVILHYLHSISPDGRAIIDPEMLQADTCVITVFLINGTQRNYRIKDNRYLSVDHHFWQTIDREQGSILFHLFQHIPSDKETGSHPNILYFYPLQRNDEYSRLNEM